MFHDVGVRVPSSALRPALSWPFLANTRYMQKTKITVELTEKQQKRFDKWCSHIKALYGEIGLLTWSITPNGIGEGIEVYSHQAKVKIDLTDVDSW